MRAVIQRVSSASVVVEAMERASIAHGLLVLLGVEHTDTLADVEYLAAKIAKLRIFSDQQGLMNLSLTEIGAEALVVSQFTLHAQTKKGNRPSYIHAARPEVAEPLYELFVKELEKFLPEKVKKGVFGADMQITLTNAGPVTIIMDSKNKE